MALGWLLATAVVRAEAPMDLDSPFLKTALIQGREGQTEERVIRKAKVGGGNVEMETSKGSISLFPQGNVLAILPRLPTGNEVYGPGDVDRALGLLEGLSTPLKQRPEASPETLAQWRELRKTTIEPTGPAAPQGHGPNAKVSTPGPPALGAVMGAEDLYEICQGEGGKALIGKFVIVHGEVVSTLSHSLWDEITKPKHIGLFAKRKNTGGNFLVKCEVRGPVVLFFQDGNLYARYGETTRNFDKNNREIKNVVFLTVDGHRVKKANDTIDVNSEFPIVNHGNRLLLAQRLKIMGINRMGDLELVGANVEDSSIPFSEIAAQSTAQLQPHRVLSSSNYRRSWDNHTTMEKVQAKLFHIFIEIRP